MLFKLLLPLLVLLISVFIASFPFRKARRELKRAREIRNLQTRLFAIQNQRHDLIESHGFQPHNENYQTLLEEEIQIRLAFGDFDPTHTFLDYIDKLLPECTDKCFVEWVRADIQRIKAPFRFVT